MSLSFGNRASSFCICEMGIIKLSSWEDKMKDCMWKTPKHCTKVSYFHWVKQSFVGKGGYLERRQSSEPDAKCCMALSCCLLWLQTKSFTQSLW